MKHSKTLQVVNRRDQHTSSQNYIIGFSSHGRDSSVLKGSGGGDIWVGSLRMGRKVQSIWEVGVHIGKSERRGPSREEASLRNNEEPKKQTLGSPKFDNF